MNIKKFNSKEKSKNFNSKEKLIIFLSFLVIILSLFNFNLESTGYIVNISDSAVINITIRQRVNINFTLDRINFGRGSIDAGKQNATIDTLGNVTDGNWSQITSGFRIENLGNTNITLYLKSNKNAFEFLGGTNPDYEYMITNEELGSCIPQNINLSQWYGVNTTGDGTEICNVFSFLGDLDTVNIDLKLVIPSDAGDGSHSDIFTATGIVID